MDNSSNQSLGERLADCLVRSGLPVVCQLWVVRLATVAAIICLLALPASVWVAIPGWPRALLMLLGAVAAAWGVVLWEFGNAWWRYGLMKRPTPVVEYLHRPPNQHLPPAA